MSRTRSMQGIWRGGLLLALLALAAGLVAAAHLPPLETVPSLDLNRYLGTWYDIAHLPFRHQRGCCNTTATYSLLPNGHIRVENRCIECDSGKTNVVVGSAWVVDHRTNAKLKVRFFWPFVGNYWVIGLGNNYEWALVGEPRRRRLWVLSRTRALDPGVYQSILAIATAKGYDLSTLELTPQNPPAPPPEEPPPPPEGGGGEPPPP